MYSRQFTWAQAQSYMKHYPASLGLASFVGQALLVILKIFPRLRAKRATSGYIYLAANIDSSAMLLAAEKFRKGNPAVWQQLELEGCLTIIVHPGTGAVRLPPHEGFREAPGRHRAQEE